MTEKTAIVTGAGRAWVGPDRGPRRPRRDRDRCARDADRLRTATAGLARVIARPGDITDAATRDGWSRRGRGPARPAGAQRGRARPVTAPGLQDYPQDALRAVLETTVLAPLALSQLALPLLRASDAGTVVTLSSDAAVEAYPGWGGYGAAKAALDQLAAVLAVEEPDLRVYAFDPGDMRTAMHQRAFPGEDIATGRGRRRWCPPSCGCSTSGHRAGDTGPSTCWRRRPARHERRRRRSP